MPAKKPALGRGLDALLGGARHRNGHANGNGNGNGHGAANGAAVAERPAAEPNGNGNGSHGESLRRLSIDRIRPNPYQPRTDFDPESLESLANSIRENGILQPLIVRPRGDAYEIVAGERRFRAAQLAGLHEVPAVVRPFDEREMTVAAIIENVQRDDLNAIEEARAYETLAAEFGLTQDQIATAIGKSRVAVTNSLRLLKLPDIVQDMVRKGELSAGHARALLGAPVEKAMIRLARDVVREGLNVRQAERRVQFLAKAGAESDPSAATRARRGGKGARDAEDLQERLTVHLGLKVRIHPETNGSGRVEVHYSSLDEFQRLCDAVGLPAAN